MYRIFIFFIGLVSCSEPCDCSEVRQQLIDSLHTVYTIQEGGYTPKAEPIAVKQVNTEPKPPVNKADKPVTTQGDIYTDKEGKTYPIHTGKKGGRYIIRTSKDTGKEYKQYLKD